MHSVARHAHDTPISLSLLTTEVSKCPPGLISLKLMVLSVYEKRSFYGFQKSLNHFPNNALETNGRK